MRNPNESRPLAIGLTVLSALGRLVPHFPNVTPVGGSCLFAGSKVSGLLAYLLPLVIMGATDPAKAAAGTIRADLAQSIEANVVHGSDAPETAAFELGYFFAGHELI